MEIEKSIQKIYVTLKEQGVKVKKIKCSKERRNQWIV